jgi:hypothetical protein
VTTIFPSQYGSGSGSACDGELSTCPVDPAAGRVLRILLISWYFPPNNTIGAVRVGKLAKYLTGRGHEVRVVAGRIPHLPKTLPLEIPEDRVVYTRFADVNAPVVFGSTLLQRLFPRGVGTDAAAGGGEPGRRARPNGLIARLSDLYTDAANLPDRHVGWLPWALTAGQRTCRNWRPDLIYASGPPFTGFLVAHRLSQELGVPWIAEYRDRWVDDPYREDPDWKTTLLDRIERRVVAGAAGIVTVSEPWAEFYRAKYAKPLALVYNGFDPADFVLDERANPPGGDGLTIAYTGQIYSGRRDPSPLFEALAGLGPDRNRVRVVFYGSDPALVLPVAERFGVRDRVEVRSSVPYRESVEIQKQADVLLLLQWNDPREQGNVPAKLFEYFAVLRPILGIGLEDGVPAKLIQARQAGFFANDPGRIAGQLRAWIAEKDRLGCLPRLPSAVREGWSRDVQFARLERFMVERIGVGVLALPEQGRSAS